MALFLSFGSYTIRYLSVFTWMQLPSTVPLDTLPGVLEIRHWSNIWSVLAVAWLASFQHIILNIHSFLTNHEVLDLYDHGVWAVMYMYMGYMYMGYIWKCTLSSKIRQWKGNKPTLIIMVQFTFYYICRDQCHMSHFTTSRVISNCVIILPIKITFTEYFKEKLNLTICIAHIQVYYHGEN